MELIELPEDYKKCSSGGEAVVRKNNGSYTVGFWYTQGFLDSGFSLFAYSNDDSRTDVIQMVNGEEITVSRVQSSQVKEKITAYWRALR